MRLTIEIGVLMYTLRSFCFNSYTLCRSWHKLHRVLPDHAGKGPVYRALGLISTCPWYCSIA
jgi:hypothetical protein